jgi:hypothetical protein
MYEPLFYKMLHLDASTYRRNLLTQKFSSLPFFILYWSLTCSNYGSVGEFVWNQRKWQLED